MPRALVCLPNYRHLPAYLHICFTSFNNVRGKASKRKSFAGQFVFFFCVCVCTLKHDFATYLFRMLAEVAEENRRVSRCCRRGNHFWHISLEKRQDVKFCSFINECLSCRIKNQSKCSKYSAKKKKRKLAIIIIVHKNNIQQPVTLKLGWLLIIKIPM